VLANAFEEVEADMVSSNEKDGTFKVVICPD